MDVKPGYGLTGIGTPPDDWECDRLGKSAAKRANAIVGGPFGSDLVSADYVSQGVPIIRGQNMGGKAVSGVFVYVSAEKAKALRANLARPGDLVFTQRGTLGQVCIVPNQPFDTYVVSQSQMKVSLDENRHDPSFVQQYFASSFGQKQILASAIQTGVPHTNLGILRRYQFPAPPLPEQRAIAAVLDDTDTLIASLEHLLAKKRDIMQGTMQEVLTGNRRLQGFVEPWEERRLVEIAHIRNGGTPSTARSDYWGGEILWCTPTDITALRGKKYLSRTVKSITRAGLSASSAELIPRRSIVMTSRATVGECAINTVDLCTNQGFKNLVPKESVDVEFLYYLLVTKKEELITLSSGSTFLEIGKARLEKFRVRLPTNRIEQLAVADVLSELDADLTVTEESLTKAKLLKQGMAQELLTGRIRLR